MAMIVFHGPKCIDAALAFKNNMGFPAWDLSPDVPESVRVDVLSAQTPTEAITFVTHAENDWLPLDGWTARAMEPVEDPYAGGVQGVEL